MGCRDYGFCLGHGKTDHREVDHAGHDNEKVVL